MPQDLRKIRFLFLAGAFIAGDLLLKWLTGYSVPCVLHCLTGLKCPGCGVTHMLMDLLVLDWKGAYAANPFLLVTSPFLLFEVICEYLLPHRNRTFQRFNNALLTVYCAALIIFGIFRNLNGCV